LNTSCYKEFRDQLQKSNIEIPVIPGIMPIKSLKGATNMADKCGISIPSSFIKLFDSNLSQSEHKKISTEFIIKQCLELSAEGFDKLHFYTLNDSEIIIDVCESLGLSNSIS
jgi:methylenetetrahydrofolate reductase (NADPH)